MLKNIIFGSSQRKINSLKPKPDIILHKEMPSPSLQEVANLSGIVSKINTYEAELKSKPDVFFKEKTRELRLTIEQRTKDVSRPDYKETIEAILDETLPYYFAMVREAAVRTVRMRHFDTQLLGGIILYKNCIAEMATGEGKTLVATLATSLCALSGKGVHIVTVNDYLARRDREWMGPIYEFLGFSVGVIQQDMENVYRKQAYACDITYGTNNEFGFDYLRDNMVRSLPEMVQRGHFFAIVDEVDSILVDEARTPLIISGAAELSTEKYYLADKTVKQLKVHCVIQSYDNKDGTITIKNTDGSEMRVSPQELESKYDAIVEEKTHNAYLTPQGEHKCERSLGVKSVSDDSPDKFSSPWMHYISQSLRAHYEFRNDREYIIKDGKVVIVDEFTGRLMPGRRWSDNLHQAIEAKENLRIQEESQTLATITLQNYFKMYAKLCGMTGTAYTEANEFRHIYKLDVVVIPTNRPLVRANNPDRIYKTKKSKFNAVIEEIQEHHKFLQPMLVGTTSIEDSETLAFLLEKKGITHNVLNAKYHEREAYIVAQAGRLGQVTIATNMAGRGTDIILGGNLDYFIKDLLRKNEIVYDDPRFKEEYEKLYQTHKAKFEQDHNKVVELGGLHVIGTQRHEARRIDNQLRGRCGRQGDPGSSRFYVSLEDDLMRLFGSERIFMIMDKLGFPEDQPIEHAMINHSLEIAQKRVEAHNFEIRKQVLDYDNVMNKQREVIYQQRVETLEKVSLADDILAMMDDVIEATVPGYCEDEINLAGLSNLFESRFAINVEAKAMENLGLEAIVRFLKDRARNAYRDKEESLGSSHMRSLEKMIMLWVVDSKWKEHLLIIDSLREGIHLRGYAHTEPIVEYQKEAHHAFDEMIYSIKEGVVDLIFKAKIESSETSAVSASVFEQAPKSFVHDQYSPLAKEEAQKPQPAQQHVLMEKKVGRNEPCPCGSGKKFKKCCGQ